LNEGTDRQANRNTAAAIAQVQRLSGPHPATAVIDSLSMIRLLCS
jgi:hypothetical protein